MWLSSHWKKQRIQNGRRKSLSLKPINRRLNALTGASAVGAGHQLLGLARLPVRFLVSQAEVTVVIGDDDTVWALLSCWQEEWQGQLILLFPQLSNVSAVSLLKCSPVTHVCGCPSNVEEMGPCLLLFPPHPPPPPGVCVCSGSSGQVGFCSASHRLQIKSLAFC